MKTIRSPMDLDQVVTVLQYLHEEDYQEAMREVHNQLVKKRLGDCRDIVNHCPMNDFPAPLSSLKEDASVLSWSMRRRFKRALKSGDYKKYRSHLEVLDAMKEMNGLSEEIDFDF